MVDEVIGSITAEDEKNRVENLAETLSLEHSDQKAVPTVDWCMYEQSMNHKKKIGLYRCYVKSPTVQDAFDIGVSPSFDWAVY